MFENKEYAIRPHIIGLGNFFTTISKPILLEWGMSEIYNEFTHFEAEETYNYYYLLKRNK